MANPFIHFSPSWCISQLHRGVFFTSSETAGCSIYSVYLYIHPLSTIRHKPSQTQLITMVDHQYSHNCASSIQYSMLIPYDTYCKLWLFMASTSQPSNAVTTGSIFPRNHLVEGSLEVKLPTIWTVEKQRWEESEETRSEERRCRCAKR